jgi:hypothetical protein
VGTRSGPEAAQVLHQHQRVLLLLVEPDRHERAEIAVVRLSRRNISWPAARPLGDGVHLDRLRLLVGEHGGVERVPWNVVVEVPAHRFEGLEQFGYSIPAP